MRKRLLGAMALCGGLLLVGCNGNNKSDDKEKREAYIDCYNEVIETLDVKEDVKKLNNVTIDDEEFIEVNDNHNAKATLCCIYFLSLIYDNDYPVNEGTYYIDAHYKVENEIVQYNSFYINNKMDKANNKINTQFYGLSYMANDPNNMNFYLNLDIDYDFDKKELNSFDLFCSDISKDINEDSNASNSVTNIALFQRFKDGVLYETDYCDEVENTLRNYYNTNYWQDLVLTLDSSENVGDYSFEYTKASDEYDIFADM